MSATISTLKASFTRNIKLRDEYESAKNDSQQITAKMIKYFLLDHKNLKTKLHDSFFQAALDCEIESFDFVNDHAKSNERFNIYALQKLAAHLRSIAQQRMIKATKLDQKFCLAMLVHLDNRKLEQFSFSNKHAHAMLSNVCANNNEISRTQFATLFNVSADTARTQVSSSFRALQALNVLRFDESSQRRVVDSVNYDHVIFALVRKYFDSIK